MFRTILRLPAIAAAAVVGVALSTAPVTGAEKIVISQWDAYMPKELLAKFKEETGIEVEWAVQIDNEEIMGKVTASGGEGYDVLFRLLAFRRSAAQAWTDRRARPRKIPNLANLYPEAQDLPARSRQQLFGSLYLGHHRPVLPLAIW